MCQFWGDGKTIYGGDSTFMDAYPLVKAHYEMMKANPKIAAYLGSTQRLTPSGREGWVDTVKATLPHLFTGELYPMKSETWHYHDANSKVQTRSDGSSGIFQGAGSR